MRGPAGSQLIPAGLYGPARRWLTPAHAGIASTPHIALTLDDGPDPVSTPRILDTLTAHRVTATFFLIGEHAVRHPELVRDMAAAGHELAVHGWTHRCTARLSPAQLSTELTRTTVALTDYIGTAPRWYRPPYGIATLSSHAAAQDAGLRTVLWSAWGRDWSRRATPEGITRRVSRTLRAGGTVLLHDTDRYSSSGSWLRTDQALRELLPQWSANGWEVGPLREHGVVDT